MDDAVGVTVDVELADEVALLLEVPLRLAALLAVWLTVVVLDPVAVPLVVGADDLVAVAVADLVAVAVAVTELVAVAVAEVIPKPAPLVNVAASLPKVIVDEEASFR